MVKYTQSYCIIDSIIIKIISISNIIISIILLRATQLTVLPCLVLISVQIYIPTRTQVWNILGWLNFTVFHHDKYVVASEAVTIVLAREVKLSG